MVTVDTHPASPFTYTNPVRESHSCYRPASYTYYTIRILRVLPVLKYTEYLDLYTLYYVQSDAYHASYVYPHNTAMMTESDRNMH
eukprot:COSAG02_NODE_6641_length_3441_cov_5.384201_4_plen_85_part_00